MKTTIKSITLFCALFFGASSFAQNLTVGVTGGYNATTYTPFSFEDVYNGWNAGLTTVWSNSSNWGIGADLLYSRAGGSYTAMNNDRTNTMNYRGVTDHVRLTPKFHYFFGDLEDNLRPTVFVGPSVSMITRSETQFGATNFSDDFNLFEVAGVVGAGLNYQIKSGLWLHANANYTVGITQLNAVPVVQPDNLRTNNLGVSLGLAYSFNKLTK